MFWNSNLPNVRVQRNRFEYPIIPYTILGLLQTMVRIHGCNARFCYNDKLKSLYSSSLPLPLPSPPPANNGVNSCFDNSRVFFFFFCQSADESLKEMVFVCLSAHPLCNVLPTSKVLRVRIFERRPMRKTPFLSLCVKFPLRFIQIRTQSNVFFRAAHRIFHSFHTMGACVARSHVRVAASLHARYYVAKSLCSG